MERAVLALALFSGLAFGIDGTTSDLASQVVRAGLDAGECYRVRDLNFSREDLRFYLTDGYVIFGNPVNGTRMSAVFTADVEGGDAELLLFPPTRAERLSLASYTDSPNLNEHFHSAVLIFTDGSYAQFIERIRAHGAITRSPERGQLLAEQWGDTVRNLTSSFQTRIIADLLSRASPQNGFFYAAIAGRQLGNFDVLFDPRAEEQIAAGQVKTRDDRTYFDTWTRFPARSFRSRIREMPASEVKLSDYRIDATLEPDLRLKVVTRAKIAPGPEGGRALGFFISRQMRVTEAKIDGVPAEVFQPESLRASLIRGGINDNVLIAPAAELQAGRQYEIEIRHEGAVVSDAGNGVYFVGARGSWYPSRGMSFAQYDLTFRYPKQLNLVATGQVIEDRTEGEQRITRRRANMPIRLAGFNLGNYQRESTTRGGYTVEVYANRRLERALESRAQQRIVIVPHTTPVPPGRNRPPEIMTFPVESLPPSPVERAEQLASEIVAGLEYMASHFGPLPLKTLTVSPIPGAFGQGFPGLIYLSTLSYLDPSQRPAAARSEYEQTFYSEILSAHETAHQWWGNLVTSATLKDEWLMEALANYSALLVLEKRKGQRAVDAVLARYKARLLAKGPNGKTAESAGPIIWGARLENSQIPGAWQTIIYEKGAWIMHMLRRRIGDERFLAMLRELRQRFEYKGISTEQFRTLAAEFLPPKSPDPQLETFFDQWIYGTGIPSLKFNHAVRGKPPSVRITGTITQTDADEDFSVYVPIEVQLARGKSVTQWVRTASGSVPFSLTVPQVPARVVFDPAESVLRK